MRTFNKLFLRLRSLLSRPRLDSELNAELRFHLDQLTEENIAAGMPHDEARSAAQRTVGGLAQFKEECRDMRRVNLIDDLVADLRYSIRSLAKSPAFTIVVIATLALGIGANTAIFTIVHGVLLRPLDHPNPDQLMELTAEAPAIGATRSPLSAPEYLDFRQMNRSFASVGAYSAGNAGYSTGEVNLTAVDRPMRVRSISVDAHLLKTLSIQPELGRLFNEEETSRWTGSLPPPIAMLSHELWQTAFGGRPIIGEKVQIEGRFHEIIGILPYAADVMDNHTQVWLPLWLHPNLASHRAAHVLNVIARRKDGVSTEAAHAELHALLQNWAERAGTKDHVPASSPVRTIDHALQLRSLQDAVVGGAGRSIWVLQGAVTFVLLIVCANLVNLVMARSGARRREYAVRAALGASRGRLLRQAITEGSLLAGAGGILGLWLAAAGLQALIHAYPASIPRTRGLAMGPSVLILALGLSVGTALLFGFIALGRKKAGSLTTRGTGTALRQQARRVLVIAQVAFAVILVIGAALLVRTVYNLTQTDAGFDRSRLVTFSMTLPMANSDPDTRAQAYQRILDRLRELPGILGAAAMSGLPPDRKPDAIATPIGNYVSEDGKQSEVIDYYQFVMGGYFRTIGIPIVAGRGFEPTDNASQGKVAVVNEALAKRLWNGQNPLGQRLRPPAGTFGGNEDSWHTVIGVARDVRQRGIEHPAGTELYLSLDQHGVSPPSMNIVMRTTLPPAALTASIERAVKEVDAAVPIVRLRGMDEVFAESIRRPRLLAQLLTAFALLALLLAAIGTYGVLSYMVAERRREIGIRVALGAARSQVLAQFLKQGMQVTGLGLAIGLGGALALNRMMAALLFGVQPTDPATIGFVLATITAVAAIASWLPAWRASRLDPNVALRDD